MGRANGSRQNYQQREEWELQYRAWEAISFMPHSRSDESRIAFSFRWYWWREEEWLRAEGNETLFRRIEEMAGDLMTHEQLEVEPELPPSPDAVEEIGDREVVHLVEQRASRICLTRVTVEAARVILRAGVIDPSHLVSGYLMASENQGCSLLGATFAFATLVGDWDEDAGIFDIWRWGEGCEEGLEPVHEGGIGGHFG